MNTKSICVCVNYMGSRVGEEWGCVHEDRQEKVTVTKIL